MTANDRRRFGRYDTAVDHQTNWRSRSPVGDRWGWWLLDMAAVVA
jgi:hypothetical protein